MTNSQFCLQQRQQEQQRLRKLLTVGFVGSAAVHGILAYALPKWSFEPLQTAEEPIEMILVDKPKPEPKPKPKIESKPVVEPEQKSIQPPEPVKPQTPPPPVKPPEPVKAQTAPPKPAPEPVPEPPAPAPTPAPKEVVTDPTPAPSQPIVSAPVENTGQPSSLSSTSFTSSSSSAVSAADSSASTTSGQPGVTGSVVAANSAPPRPEANDGGEEGISCVSNCEPEYPASLKGTEGSAGVKLTIDSNGNVIGAELADPDSNSGINRQALLAARQMQFSSPGDNAASVQVKIDFTVEGSQYDRARREEQEKREQAARERQEQEAAARQQAEVEKQAQQEQLERERQARQEQLEQQQQESAPPPAAETKPAPEPLPALSEEELDEERLRKFRERIENYQ